MRKTIAMIVCNEGLFIERNLRNHYALADKIIIVEGAVEKYAEVIGGYTSTDRTVEVIETFPDPAKKITLVKPTRPWKSKIEMQNEFCDRAEDGILLKIDADEFYHPEDVEKMYKAYEDDIELDLIFPYWHHFWGDMDHVITGRRWDVPHCKIWRFRPGYRYETTHNRMSRGGREIGRQTGKVIRIEGLYCYHYGYLKPPEWNEKKFEFYKKRCEAGTGEWFGQNDDGGHIQKFRGNHPSIMEGVFDGTETIF